jgi:hypothetical protein
VDDLSLTPAIGAELQNKQKETKAQRQRDEGTVYMQRILDYASNGSAGNPSRHAERESDELLLDDCPHGTNIANDWRGRSRLSQDNRRQSSA